MSQPPLLFLDIDGVLNAHENATDYICGIDRDKIVRLNEIVKATGAEVVISSAWRYMILNGAMTIDGFRYMLTTHRLASFVKIVGHTKSDEAIPDRGDQITDYLLTYCDLCRSYAVLDDGSEDAQTGRLSMSDSLIQHHGPRWIRVDGDVGLTNTDVAMAVAALLTPLRGERRTA